MKLEAKNIANKIGRNFLPAVLLLSAAFLFTKPASAYRTDSNPAAPADTNHANATCPTAGLSDKQYDESKCTTDSKCDASSSCVDASPIGSVNRVSDPFGYRIHPITGKGTGHKGVDYAATAGTPIYAAADGIIIEKRYQYSASSGTGYGNLIKLQADNPQGTTVLYAHMACFAAGITAGTHVKKGQIIGFVGNTGGSTGAHLHYEVQKNGVAVDPFGDDASSVVCTPDDRIAEMNENAVAGGRGTASDGGGYNSTDEKADVGTGGGGGSGGSARPNLEELTGVVGNIDSPANDGHKDRDCLPSVLKQRIQTCLFCNLFRAAFLTASNIAQKSFETLAPWVTILISVAFAVWMAIKVLSHVSAMESKDAPTLIKTLLNQTFIFIIVYIFLTSDSNYFMKMAMEPIFNTGFKLAQLVMQSSVECTDTYNLSGEMNEGGLPASMGISILCTIAAIQDRIMDVLVVGSSSICVAFFVEYYTFLHLPHPAYLLSGIGMWVSGLLLLVIFPFLMLDAVLQLAVACALLPAAIGAYTFKSTRSYVIKVWESFISAMFHFVFLTIIMMILITAIENSIGEALGALDKVTDQGLWQTALTDLSWTGVLFLQIVFVLLLGWAVLGQISQFARRFTSSVSNTNIGTTIGTLAASGAKNATSRVIAPAASAINSKLGLGALGGAIGRQYDAAKKSISQHSQTVRANKFTSGGFKNKANYSESIDSDGNTTYSYQERSGLLRRKQEKSVTIDKQGQIIADNTGGQRITGGTSRTEKHGPIELKSVTDAAGREVKRDIRITDKEMSGIVQADGKINMQAASALRNVPGIDPKLAGEAMMMTVMQQRMPDVMSRLNILNNMESQGEITNGSDGSLTMTKVEKDGTTHNFSMRVDQESGQIITVYEKQGKANSKGIRESTVMFSNGVVNSVQERKLAADGTVVPKSEKKPRFGINSYYTQGHLRSAIDYKGRLADFMPKESIAFAGMSAEQVEAIKKHYKENPGDRGNPEEFIKNKKDNMLGRLGSYLRNQGEAILTEDSEFIGLSEEEIETIKKQRRGDY